MSTEHVMHDKLEQASNPVAPLALIALPSCDNFAVKVNEWIRYFRMGDHNEHRDDPAYKGYYKDDYRLPVVLPRFSTGEGKAVLEQSTRGKDVYIFVDITNHSITYQMNGFTNHMSPDDHFQIMYKELCDLGIKNFITFDAHDPRIQNVNPLVDFSNFTSPYQFMKSLMRSVDDLIIDKDHIVVISPDEGALDRTVYFANVIGADTGMFYKRRDYSVIVNGKNPIVAHEFLGTDLDGKDAIIIDDMISSGGSILDTSRQLKQNMHAKRVFLCTTFGLFTDGLDVFDEAYEKGYFDKLVTTNLTYQPPELKDRVWFEEADMSKYTAMIIDFINHDTGLSSMRTPTDKIHKILEKINKNEQTEFEQMQLEQTEF